MLDPAVYIYSITGDLLPEVKCTVYACPTNIIDKYNTWVNIKKWYLVPHCVEWTEFIRKLALYVGQAYTESLHSHTLSNAALQQQHLTAVPLLTIAPAAQAMVALVAMVRLRLCIYHKYNTHITSPYIHRLRNHGGSCLHKICSMGGFNLAAQCICIR